MRELIENLKKVLENEIERKRDELVEQYPEEYIKGYDSDYVDVGVGSVCVREDPIYYESRLDRDAKDELIEEFMSQDILFENITDNAEIMAGFAKVLTILMRGL